MDVAVAQRLQEGIAAAKGIANGMGPGCKEQVELLDAYERKLASRRLYAAALGLVNSGKSTTLNALLRKEVLPASVQPQTAAEVKVIHAPDRPQGELSVEGQGAPVFSGASAIYQALTGFNEQIRSGKGGNEKLVLRAPFPFLQEGPQAQQGGITLEIADTAGVNEAGSPNVSLGINKELELFAAFIVILNCATLCTEDERSLLSSLKAAHPVLFQQHTQRVLVLVNGIDLCHDGSRSSLKQEDIPTYVATYLKDKIGIPVPPSRIIPYSAKWGFCARVWRAAANPSTDISETQFDKARTVLVASGCKEVTNIYEPTTENIAHFCTLLEDFSRIHTVEQELFKLLVQQGSSILYQGTAQNVLQCVQSLRAKADEERTAQQLPQKTAALEQQRKLLQSLNQSVSKHTSILQNLSSSVATNTRAQVDGAIAALKAGICGEINTRLVGHLSNVHNKETQQEVATRILQFRDLPAGIASSQMATSWNNIMAAVRSSALSTLNGLLAQAKNEIASATSNKVTPSFQDAAKLVPAALPPFQQSSLSAAANSVTSDANLSSKVIRTENSITKTRTVVHVTKKKKNFKNKKKRHYVEVPYTVPGFSPDTASIQAAFASLVGTWLQQFQQQVAASTSQLSSSSGTSAVQELNRAVSSGKDTLEAEIQRQQSACSASTTVVNNLTAKLQSLELASGKLI